MRVLAGAVLVIAAACSNPSAPPAARASHDPGVSIADLTFNDAELQVIALRLREEAQLRGIGTSAGQTRVERLLSLELAIRGEGRAFARVNKLVADITSTDASQWGKLRQRADRELAKENGEAARRVRDLLARWQRRKTEIVYRYLSSNYDSQWIPTMEWERRFHDFVTERPIDAATWGWLLLREHAKDAQQQYGEASAESAYRFYVEFSGLADGREARRMFSVPGIEIGR